MNSDWLIRAYFASPAKQKELKHPPKCFGVPKWDTQYKTDSSRLPLCGVVILIITLQSVGLCLQCSDNEIYESEHPEHCFLVSSCFPLNKNDKVSNLEKQDDSRG